MNRLERDYAGLAEGRVWILSWLISCTGQEERGIREIIIEACLEHFIRQMKGN
jgi:hypothetical protein